jgi:peptidoglycan/LPS O-acetylase OafA/YrhL
MAWLDALRGIAALMVVYTHFALNALPGLYQATNSWWLAGTFGVALFFVISGYIVPASLERHGSVRSFWISRFFRLYPLWIAAIGAVFLLHVTAVRTMTPGAVAHWKQYLLAHLTMLQQLMRVESYINVMWTLSLEMAFYFMVVALYSLGLHRRSAEMSAAFAAGALAGTLAGFQGLLFMRHLGVKTVAAAVIVIFAVGLILSLTGRRPLVLAGALMLGSMGVLLLLFNQEPRTWFFLLLPATMFAGTAVYRAVEGQIPKWKAGAAVTFLIVIAIVNPVVYAVRTGGELGAAVKDAVTTNVNWIITIASVVAAFVIGRALRNRKMPRVLTLLGVMSYSTYLLHPLIHQAIQGHLGGHTLGYRIGMFAIWWAALLGGAYLTYRLIEAPAQQAGRRMIKWADRRFGPDTSLRHASAPAAAGQLPAQRAGQTTQTPQTSQSAPSQR